MLRQLRLLIPSRPASAYSRLPVEIRLVVMICLCHGMIHALEMLLPTLRLSLSGEMRLSELQYGWIQGSFAVLFGLGSLPVGFLSDRLGARWTLLMGMAGCGVMAMVSGLVGSVNGLTWAMVGLGAFSSFYHPTGLSWVASAVTYRGKAFAYHGVAGNLGLSLGPVLAGVIAALHPTWGWRAAFMVFGLLTWGIVWQVWRVGGEVARHQRQHDPSLTPVPSSDTRGDTTGAGPISGTSQHPSPQVPPVRPKMGEFLRTASVPLVLILINGAFFGVIYRGFVSYFPQFVATHVTWSGGNVSIVGLLTSLAFFVGIAGQLLGGYLTHWIRKVEYVYPFIFLFAAYGVWFMAHSQNGPFLLAAMGFNLILFLWQPINNLLVAQYAPKGYSGTAFGLSFGSQFTAGGIAPWIMGWIATHISLEATFTSLVGFCALGLLSSAGIVAWRGSDLPVATWWLERRASRQTSR